jgi:hypothetical protein
MVSQVLTANRLIDGDVVYWHAGAWVEALAQAEIFAGEVDAEAAVAAATRFVDENVVVNPYLFELKGDRPAKEREIIRALGPSVREDVGKQAADLPSGFSPSELRRDKPVEERDDDVSI